MTNYTNVDPNEYRDAQPFEDEYEGDYAASKNKIASPVRCPNCGSFAWYDDTATLTDDDGELADADVCRCEDCGHVWSYADA